MGRGVAEKDKKALRGWKRIAGVQKSQILRGCIAYYPRELFCTRYLLKVVSDRMMQLLEGSLSLPVEVMKYVFLCIRVLGSVTNFKEFGKAYSCRSGSKMNPTRRCEFW